MILLDTNVVIWLASDPARISKAAVNAINNARHSGEPLAICGITLLELATLWSKGRVRTQLTLQSLLDDIEKRFVVLPITANACAQILMLPASYPHDPADRMIGATALAEGLTLITADRPIRTSRAFPTIW